MKVRWRDGFLCLVLLLGGLIGSAAGRHRSSPYAVDTLTVTAYCPCSICCGEWAGMGLTASGKPARGKLVAADTNHYPFHTRLDIPGYGAWVPVLDRGGAIKGPNRLDIFMEPTGESKQELEAAHQRARAWGVKRIQVRIHRTRG